MHTKGYADDKILHWRLETGERMNCFMQLSAFADHEMEMVATDLHRMQTFRWPASSSVCYCWLLLLRRYVTYQP
jgi:hypothetical protein